MTAAEIFEREQIVSLPLDPAALANRNGIKLVTYSAFLSAGGSAAALPSQDGFLIRGASSPAIVYNERIPCKGRQRWTLIHELCHFWLGHPSSDPHTERITDRLTASLLAPLPVLHLCGVTNAQQIVRLCGISAEAARNRLEELQRLRRGRGFLKSEEEICIVRRFLPYISDTVSLLTMEQVCRSRVRSVDIF